MSSLRKRQLTLICGLIASLPILGQAVHTVVVDWHPIGDDAVIAVRALDTLTADAQLLGMPSFGASSVIDEPISHLGPLLFWLLALPARLPWPSALEVTVGVVNFASVLGTVTLARRRGGRPLMVAVTLAVPLMLASLPAEALSDIWNPAAALMPFLLLIFCSWSLACGEYRLLPVVVLAASFVVQGHLTFAAPVVGALIVGLVGLLRSGARPTRGWLWATAAVALICWSAPLVEQATNRPGNLVLLARASVADEPTLGAGAGIRAVVRAVGVPPWWLRAERDPVERASDLTTDPAPLTSVSALLVLAGLAGFLATALHRRRREVVAAAAIGLVLCAALALTAASGPQAAVLTSNYALWWASPAGMFVWLALGLGAFAMLPRVRLPKQATAVAVALAAACAVLVTLGANRPAEPTDEMRALAQRLVERVPPDGVVRVDGLSSRASRLLALDFQAGAVYALRRQGREVTTPFFAAALGKPYRDRGVHRTSVNVYVDRPAPPGARVSAHFKMPWQRRLVPVTVAIDPAPR